MDPAIMAAVAGTVGAFLGTIATIMAQSRRHVRELEDTPSGLHRMSELIVARMHKDDTAAEQIRTWMLDERKRAERCELRCAELTTQVHAQGKHIVEQDREIKRLGREVVVLQQENKELRGTLIRDYARKSDSIPAGPPDPDQIDTPAETFLAKQRKS